MAGEIARKTIHVSWKMETGKSAVLEALLGAKAASKAKHIRRWGQNVAVQPAAA